MGKNIKRLCTVCARGGSKGVRNKNIRPLDGVPLILHTLEQAQESNLFNAIAVSSDSDEILQIASKWGCDYVVKRSAELASDEAPKLPAIRQCVLQVENFAGTKFDTLVDLDATSPLRLPEDIRNAVKILEDGRFENIISVMPSRRSPYFNMVEIDSDGRVGLSKKAHAEISRRQDAPKCYDMNASIYVWRRDSLFTNEALFSPGTRAYIMPEERSVDIDSELDFLLVEMLMSISRNKEN